MTSPRRSSTPPTARVSTSSSTSVSLVARSGAASIVPSLLLTLLSTLLAVGANYWVPNLASLAKDGRLVLLGLLSGGDVPKASTP